MYNEYLTYSDRSSQPGSIAFAPAAPVAPACAARPSQYCLPRRSRQSFLTRMHWHTDVLPLAPAQKK